MVISLGNKTTVKLGVVAANKQTAMCMHMDYQVRLPNHDYVVGAKHTLTPSVYAFLTILPSRIGRRGAVTYTGPQWYTFEAVNMTWQTRKLIGLILWKS